jgi:hypothetical protein
LFPHVAKIGVFLAGLVLALSVPAFAFAANTAAFSGAAPKPSTTATKPTLSVMVYDKYGVLGSANRTLTLDGVKKTTIRTNVIGWGDRKFKLSYAVPTDLVIGSVHTVIAKIHDLHGKNSTYTWTFTVVDGAPPVTTTDALPGYGGPATIHLYWSDNSGTGVHTYYKLDGALTPTLYASGIPVPRPHSLSELHWLEFWSVDAAGNVESHHLISYVATISLARLHDLPELSCTASGCHDTTLMAIHLDRCSRCHNGDELTSNCITCHGSNPPNHDPHVSVTSTSTPACTSCHGTNVGGIHQNCAVCHADSDFDAIIAAGGAHCETCHPESYAYIHTKDAHTVVGNTCSTDVCHASADAVTIHTGHGGCTDCHDPTSAADRNKVTSMATCGTTPTCHSTDINVVHHTVLPGAHVSTDSCAGVNDATCHVTNVLTIHTTRIAGFTGTVPGCAACHVTGTVPSTTCADCHDGFNHSSPAVDAHNAATNTYWSGCSNSSDCHAVSSDASVIHSIWAGAPGCVACHAPSKIPSVDCYTVGCHPADFHGVNQTTKHTFTALPSACAACHSNNLQTEHFGKYGGLACATCHQNTDARVIAAIADGVNACIACHSGTGSDANLNSNYHGFEFLNPANASGHTVTGGASIGAKTRFDGLSGNPLLTWESEIASSSLNATWLVGAGQPPAIRPSGITSISVGQQGAVSTQWDFPTVNVFWGSSDPSAPLTAVKGLTATSTITCSGINGCHDAAAGIQATGPHGSTQTWALDSNYPGHFYMAELTKLTTGFPAGIKMRSTLTTATQTYTDGATGPNAVICAKCHDLENYMSGTTAHSPLPLISTGSGTFVHDSQTYTPVWFVGSRSSAWTVWTDASGNMVAGSDPATSTSQAWSQAATGTLNVAAIGASNTAHASHHQDQTDGSPQCVNCHVAIPHGWKAPRLLVNTGKATALGTPAEVVLGDSAPYLSPNALGTSRNNGGVPMFGGWNKQGMLTLSAVDDHTLYGGGYVYAASGSIVPTNTLVGKYITGAASWSEPGCQGCNEHAGEDGIRIISEP